MEANNNYNDVKIVKSVSLVAFAKQHGLPRFREDVNKETGETFNSIAFPGEDGQRIFCHFARTTKGMTMNEIIAQKDDLAVGLNSNGKYTLYKPDNGGEVIALW
jgi:hypothetical protein